MSISDELMWKYYTLCTDLTPAQISDIRTNEHPMAAKRNLAKLIITDFHSVAAAEEAEKEFGRVFSARELPADLEEKRLTASDEPQLLARIITTAGLAESNKDAQRLIAQGGVLVDDGKVDDSRHALDASAGKSYVLKVGKRRFARVTFE
jgi:tyrosyl-tRNA synthetase